MKLEAGKSYRSRSGDRIGPITAFGGYFECDGWHFASDGTSSVEGRLPRPSGQDWRAPRDLVAEWSEGPVRTVTRKEIVYGVFDSVLVNETGAGGTLESVEVLKVRTPSELRAAAATLIEIADALESQA